MGSPAKKAPGPVTATAMRTRLRSQYPLLVAGAVAIVSIIVAYASTPTPPAVHDALGYVRTAQNLVANHVYSYAIDPSTTPNATQTPGYPLVLSAVFAVVPRGASWDDWAQAAQPFITALQMLMAAGIVLCTVQAGRRLGGNRFGLVAGVLAALYVPYFWAARVQLSDLLGSLLIAGSLWCALVMTAKGEPSRRVFVLFGLLMGAVAMVRPAYSLWAVVPFVYLFLVRGRSRAETVKAAALSAAVAILVMTPWWVRNVVTLDELVLLNTNSGVTMLDGLGGRTLTEEESRISDAADADGKDGATAVAWHRIRQGFGSSPSAFIASRNAAAWRAVSTAWNPIRDALWEDAYDYDEQRIQYGPFPQQPRALLVAVHEATSGYHLFLLAAAVAGVLFVRASPRLALPLSLPVYAVIVHYLTIFTDRYFLPAMPGVMLMSTAGLVGAYLWLRRRLTAAR